MRFSASHFLAGLTLLIGSAVVAPAQDDFDPFAAAGAAGGRAPTKVEFLSEMQSIAPGKPFQVAIKLEHPPGWHSYFINTGSVGLVLNPNWKLPEGFEVERVGWPIPHTGETGGMTTYGYEGVVYHLFTLTPPATLEVGSEAEIKTTPSWQVCDADSCVLEPGFGKEVTYTLKLPVTAEAQPNPATDEAFSAARAMLPKELPDDLTVAATKDSTTITLRLTPASAVPDDEIHFFDYEPQIDAQTAPRVEREGDTVRVIMQRNKEEDAPTSDRLTGILAIGKDGYAVDVEYRKAEAKPVAFGKFMTILGGMFLGGMILNLMPCVFPVIGLKIMGFVQQAGEDRKTILVHGFIYALGVILSFWVVAGLLLALREGAFGAAGDDVGWGYQLQNPWVVWILMLIMFILGLNMFGVFEIGTSATSVGGGLARKQGVSGSFFSGVLATVVATPCSAPFLGAAIGLAIGLSPILFMLSFTFMALGLAFPYVLLSAFPKLVEKLPRPGAWMESFKQAMSFLLFATAGFLLSVYIQQIEIDFMLKVIIGLTCVGIGLWVYGRWCTVSRSKRARTVGLAFAILFTLLGLAASKPPEEGLEWTKWSPEKVEEALAEGRPVFVDFTASWCATCKANKARAYPPEVQRLFNKHNILALKADKTKPDPQIEQAIAELGRAAIPVNVLYVPGQEEPHLTKELFGAGYMMEFLNEHLEGAGGNAATQPGQKTAARE